MRVIRVAPSPATSLVAHGRPLALVHVTNELSGLIGASGQTLPPHQELSLRVFVKGDDGAWRLAAFRNTPIAPPP